MESVRIYIHALTQSSSTCPPRRPRPTLPPGLSRTPPTGVFPEGDRLEANDEVRPTQLRLPPGSLPASWPLLRMDLQDPGQNRQREAQPASRAALSGRHQTAPHTQDRPGQDGALVAIRVSSLGQASFPYRLNRHRQSLPQTVDRPPAHPAGLSHLFSVTCPPCTARLAVLDEKSGLTE